MAKRQTTGKAKAEPKQTRPDDGPLAPEDIFKGRTLGSRSNPADDLPPDKLVRILRDAEDGNITQAAKMMRAMEQRDPVIYGFLSTRRSGVLACGYEIVPDDEADDETAADEAAALVKEHISRLDTQSGIDHPDQGIRFLPTWQGMLAIALDAIGKEFSALELLWDTAGGEWRIDHAEWRPQWWFQFGAPGAPTSAVPHDELRLRTDKPEGQWLNPLNFWVHRQHALAGVPGTTGLLLALARPYVVSNYALTDALQVAEVFGMPWRVGWFDEGADDATKLKSWRMLLGMASNGCAMFPKGTEFKIFETGAANAGTMHERLLELADRWKALAILGQLSSIEEGGSYAKATALQMIRFDLLDSDAGELEKSVRKQVFAPIVRLNLGADVPVPRLTIPRQEPRDLKAQIDAYSAAAGMGIRISRRWAQEQLGIPEPADDEDVLTAPAPVNPFGAPPIAASAEGPKKKARMIRAERFVC